MSGIADLATTHNISERLYWNLRLETGEIES